MYALIVKVLVKPGAENSAAWESAIKANRAASRTEPGNVRFDVLKAIPANSAADDSAPVEYSLVEVYHTAEDFAAHQRTAHYLTFRNAVADLMAEPRRPAFYTSIAPEPWE